MKRRDFLKAGAAALGAAATTASVAQAHGSRGAAKPEQRGGRFKLRFAPHFGMFRHTAGDDLVDQLAFAADQGFAAWEDSRMRARPVSTQQRLARAMQRLDIEMGAFVATDRFAEATVAVDDRGVRDAVLRDVRTSVDVARRVRARWMTVVPGRCSDPFDAGAQAARCIELLKRCCEIVEPHGLVLLVEPIGASVHGGDFLRTTSEALRVCRAVGSPACKILFDMYHRQVAEGSLLSSIDMAWSEIAYFQCGDAPGRKEPGTGEINYANVFRHLHAKGYNGIVGMEHGNSKPGVEGEQAVIRAYVEANRF